MLSSCSLQLVFPNAHPCEQQVFSAISWELFYTPESPEMTELDQSRARVHSSAWVASLLCPHIIWWCSERTCYCDRIHQKEEKYIFREMMSPEKLRHGQVQVYTWSNLKKCLWPSINDILLTCLWWRTISICLGEWAISLFFSFFFLLFLFFIQTKAFVNKKQTQSRWDLTFHNAKTKLLFNPSKLIYCVRHLFCC